MKSRYYFIEANYDKITQESESSSMDIWLSLLVQPYILLCFTSYFIFLQSWGLIPGWGRSGGGHGNPPQYSCLENPMDRGGWQATVHGVAKSRTAWGTERAHTHPLPYTSLHISQLSFQKHKTRAPVSGCHLWQLQTYGTRYKLWNAYRERNIWNLKVFSSLTLWGILREVRLCSLCFGFPSLHQRFPKQDYKQQF